MSARVFKFISYLGLVLPHAGVSTRGGMHDFDGVSWRARVFFAVILVGAGILSIAFYLYFMVSIMVHSGELPERERLLRSLDEERRVQYALVSAARSPEKITDQATRDLQMVPISEITYIGAEEPVAVSRAD